ncbi:MAG: PQQ-dependent sugar dehydrogenase [Chloroflexota bacterium]|nr:PQQ-dependent sugar dehydrogenase [Chloroflexota bacterium]
MNKQVIWMGAFLVLMMSAFVGTAQDSTVLRDAAPDPNAASLVEVADGFTRPIYLTHAGDDSARLFVVEQGGKIWILDQDTRLDQPFLDISDQISQEAVNVQGYTERGLLGLAFHPQYAENGLFFVNYTDDNAGTTIVARYNVSTDDANRADPSSAVEIMRVEQPFPNHNGGHIAFGADGYLYISFGDGGSGGDPFDNGQDLTTLLGSIARIDIDVPDGEGYAVPADNPFVGRADASPEIWVYGVRNVWRFSFDAATGDLYAADVGQNAWEEVNFIPAGQGGVNLGWNVYEGTHPFSGAAGSADMVMPIAEYSHTLGISVTGGYVYRGDAIPDWQGAYLYGDFGSGIMWSAYRDSAGEWADTLLLDTGHSISSFGEDQAGELYLVDYSGSVYRFGPVSNS